MAIKKTSKAKASMLLIPPQEVMSHFCYAYAKALLMALKKIESHNAIISEGSRTLTPITYAVCNQLAEQINHYNSFNMGDNAEEVKCLITTAEKFLAIFKV